MLDISKDITKRFLKAKDFIVGEHGITDQEFCPTVGINNKSVLSSMNSGKNNCTLKHVYLIARKYSISLDWLILGKGEMKAKPDKGLHAKIDLLDEKFDGLISKMVDAMIQVKAGNNPISAKDFLKKINKS